jgi:hypothetical protein
MQVPFIDGSFYWWKQIYLSATWSPLGPFHQCSHSLRWHYSMSKWSNMWSQMPFSLKEKEYSNSFSVRSRRCSMITKRQSRGISSRLIKSTLKRCSSLDSAMLWCSIHLKLRTIWAKVSNTFKCSTYPSSLKWKQYSYPGWVQCLASLRRKWLSMAHARLKKHSRLKTLITN